MTEKQKKAQEKALALHNSYNAGNQQKEAKHQAGTAASAAAAGKTSTGKQQTQRQNALDLHNQYQRQFSGAGRVAADDSQGKWAQSFQELQKYVSRDTYNADTVTDWVNKLTAEYNRMSRKEKPNAGITAAYRALDSFKKQGAAARYQATQKAMARGQTASGLLAGDLENVQKARAEYEEQLKQVRGNLYGESVPYIARDGKAQSGELSAHGNYGAVVGQYGYAKERPDDATQELRKQEKELTEKIGGIDAVLNIYDRVDRFQNERVRPLTGKAGFASARADYAKRAAERTGKLEEAYAADFDATDTNQRKAYDQAIKQAEEENRDELGEYLNWYEGLEKKTQGNLLSGNLNPQAPENQQLVKSQPSTISKHWERMTADEINAYYYIANTEGMGAAKEFLDELQFTLDRRHTLGREEATRERMEKASVGGNALRGIATVGANLIGSPMAFVGDVLDKVQGEDFNPYSNTHYLQNISGTIRSEAAADIQKTIAGDGQSAFWNGVGEITANAYQAGLSSLDSWAGMVTMGNAYTVAMGMGAASSRMRELMESGASEQQIYIGAIGSGILEAFFEKVSLDSFSDKFIRANPEKWVKKVLLQAGVEASEEIFTEISNQILDAINRGVNSDHNQRVRELMSFAENPMSRQEAERQATAEAAMEVFWAGFGGAISGGMSSVGGAAIENTRATQVGKGILAGNAQGQLLAEAQELRPNDETAHNLKGKLDAGTLGRNEGLFKGAKDGSDAASLGRMYEHNVADMLSRDSHSVQVAVENRLRDLNRDIRNPEATAQAIVKTITGEKQEVTDKYYLHINQKYADQIRQEIFAADGAEGVDNSWVRSIKTYALGADRFATRELDAQRIDRESMEKTSKEIFDQLDQVVNQSYMSGQNRAAYVAEMAEVYRASQNGTALEDVPKTQTLTKDQRELAWHMGQDQSSYAYDNHQGYATIRGEVEPVNIVGVASAEHGQLVLQTDEGETVNATDVTFGSYAESKLYSVIASMGVDSGVANEIVDMSRTGGESLSQFVAGLQSAFQSGRSGISFNQIRTDSPGGRLEKTARRTAWEAGWKVRQRKAEAKARTVQEKKHGKAEGGLRFDKSAKNLKKRNAQQEAGLNAARVLSAMGLDITVYASTEKQRTDGMANGHIRLSDGSIHIDLNAGDGGEGVMAWAVSHEFTHFVEELSPEKFQVFQTTLFDVLGKSGTDVQSLIEEKVAVLSQQTAYQNYSEETLWAVATSEAVAEMMEPVLTDTDAISQIAEKIRQQDKGLWTKIKDWISGLVEKLKNAYKDLTPDSAIARQTREIVTQSEAILNAWVDTAADAIANYNLQDGQKNNTPDGVRFSTRNVNGENIVWIENSGLTSKQLQNHQAVADYIAQHVGEVYTILESGMKVYLGEDLPGEYTHSRYTSYLSKRNTATLRAKNKATDGIGEMIEIASNRRWEVTRHGDSKDARYGMYRYDSKFAFPVKDTYGEIIGVKAYDVELLIRNASDGKKYLYDIVNIKRNTANALDLQDREARKGGYEAARQSSTSTDSIRTNSKNVNPEDTLFSSRNVQQTKNLVAIHNLTEDKLLKTLELGGFPMPSIAVTKADIPHTNFGEITVVFGRETIDPNIFEAKPERAVGFDEIKNVLVPDHASRKLLQELDQRGIPYQTYQTGNEEQRHQMVRDMEDIRFSQRSSVQKEYARDAEKFVAELEQWGIDGRPENQHFVLGSTGEVLQGLGAIESDIYISGEKIRTILEKHPEITMQEIKQIPQILNDPVLILKSRNVGHTGQNTRMTLFGSVKGTNGLPVMTVFDLRPMENQFVINDMQKVTSAYTKTTNAVQFVQSSEVMYADKKRATSLLRSIGFYMPIELLQSGFTGSITYRQRSVNLYGEKFSDVFAQEEVTRFSQRTSAQLERENEKLRSDVAYLKELVQIHKHGNKKVVAQRSSVNKQAEVLKKAAGAKGKTAELAALLDDLYRYVGAGKDITNEGLTSRAEKAADWLLDHRQAQRDPYAQEVLDWMAKRRVSLSQTQVGEIEYQYGSISEFKKAIKGSIILDQNANTSLDQLWQEGSDQFADQFDRNINAADMPAAFAERVETLRSSEDTDSAESEYYRDALRQDLIHEVYDSYFSVKPVTSVTDQMQEQIDQLKAEKKALKQKAKSQLKAEQEARKNALDSYKYQRDVIDKAMKALYEQQYKEVQAKYRRETAELEALYEQQYKEAQTEHRREMAELESQHKEDNQIWNREFKRLSTAYDHSNKDVQRLRKTAEEKLERRKQTELRGKLQRRVNALNRMLLNPTKTQYVPDSLQPAVIEAMEVMNQIRLNDHPNVALIRKYQEEKAKLMEESVAKNADRIDLINRQLAKLEGRNATLQAALSNMKRLYQELGKSNDGKVTQIYDEQVEEYITNALDAVGNTQYSDLSRKQLEAVNDAYAAILHRVRTANKSFADARGLEISQLAEAAEKELGAMEDRPALTSKNKQAVDKFGWNNLKPVYAFRRMGSATFQRLYENLRKGEDTFYRDVVGGRAWALECMSEFHYDTWEDSLVEYESQGGKKFSLNLEERMSLYAYSRREQAIEHLTKGGIVLNENTERTVKNWLGIKRKKIFNDANSYTLSLETIDTIRESLTEEQRGFAEKMQMYLSTVCAEKNNEISRALYGVSIAKEEVYWPLRSSGLFSEKVRDSQENPGNRQKNAGHMKATVKHANNPIELSGFMETWATHVNNTAMYHSFTLPMEDFYRVYNWKGKASEDGDSKGIRQLMTAKLGKGAVEYIDQLLKDLNGGVRADPRESIASTLTSKFKKGAVSASLSVAIQQPSAVGRAFAVIDPKYFSLADMRYYVTSTVGQKKAETEWETVKEYAPVAGIKEWGRFDTNMGRSTLDIITGAGESGLLAKLDEISGYLPEKMDQATWLMIWNAAKRQTKAKTGLTGESLLEKTGELFTKCIIQTQVYDSVLSRSGNMRSKGLFMNMATSFMAEPTTTANMFQDAMAMMKNGQKGQGARALAAIGSATVLNALLASLVYASRDDDDDKPWKEKYLKSLTSELIESLNPMGYVPIAKDIYSIFQGYDVDRADMTLWGDMADMLERMKSAYEAMEGLDEDSVEYDEQLKAAQKKMWEASWNAVGALANLYGVPAKNVIREVRAIFNTVETEGEDRAMDGTTAKYAMWEAAMDNLPELIRDTDSREEELYKAMTSGSNVWIQRMKDSYGDDKSFQSGVRDALREYDPRIRQAAKVLNGNDPDLYQRIVKGIVGEGYFTQEQVDGAIWAEAAAIKGELTDYNPNTVEKFVDLYEDKLLTADQFTDFWEYKGAKDENDKKLHSQDEIIVYISKMRVNATAKDKLYLLAGYSEKKLDQMPWHNANGTIYEVRLEHSALKDISDTGAEKFLEVQSEEITAELFANVWEVKQARNEDNTYLYNQREVIAYIDSLPISDYSKDELYLAFWDEKKLSKAPWNK